MCEWERNKRKEKDPEELTDVHADPPPASAGVTYELCAGLVDKPHLSLEEIARQEVLEECGYDVPADKLRRITSYRYWFIRNIILSLTGTCISLDVGLFPVSMLL